MAKSKGDSDGDTNGVPKEVVINGLVLRKKFANLYGTFGSDPALEEKGILCEYELEDGGLAIFKIKRAGARNPEWRKAYNQVMKPHVEDIQNDIITEQENQILLAEIYSRTVIIGWSGILDSEGQEVPFSITNCMELLCFFPPLLEMIIKDAHKRSNFQHQELEQTAKNS